jgi:hypothetical protein
MRHPVIATLFVLLVAAVVLIGYDVWLYVRGGTQATISWQTYLSARNEPIIPLVLGLIVGILFGHLFWPNRGQ